MVPGHRQKDIRFVYDGWNMVRQTSTPQGQPSVDTYYVWGIDLSQSMQGAGGIGGLVARVEGSLIYEYLYDANGNVGQVVDSERGSVVAHYEYDPYGNEVVAAGVFAQENVFRFSTKYFDEESGLGYWGYRYYSPELGRWMNRDPIEESGGQNIYAYVSGNPNSFVDRYGKKFVSGVEMHRDQVDFGVGEWDIFG
jgi:RHS repeat-associated protein